MPAVGWRAIEDLVRAGLVQNIGVSNFNISLLRDLLSYAQIAPAVLQVEMHPSLTQERFLSDLRIRYACASNANATTTASPP